MELTAAAEDMDMLEHVSNLVYVRWIQEVAEAHSSSLGFDMRAYHRLGGVWVVRRHEIDYLASAFAGDRLCLRTWVESWKAASCVRRTSITRLDTAREVPLVRASTTWVFVSFETNRPQRIPDELLAAFG